MIPKDMYKEMEDVLGPDNISQEPGVLDGYAWQPVLSLFKTKWLNRPAAVVLPETTEEVQKIVKIINKHKMKFKAFSTGWAAWGGPSQEGVVQIDLVRMNRIIEIDEKNMYAVVEPYVCGSQLQAEAMKKGLNCHIIGAGPNCSPLASTTAGWGYGHTGLMTSFGGRNALSVEWVLPDGDVLTIGSAGSGGAWFSGEGPGIGLRGIMRGFGGTQGGLGVFTKCAIKLYPWYGPRKIEVKGVLLDVQTEVPETEKVFYAIAPSYENFADLAYKIGNAEIGYVFCKESPAAYLMLILPRHADKFFESETMKSMLKAFQHFALIMLSAGSKRQAEYEEKVLRKIVAETDSILIDAKNLPNYGATWWTTVRSALTAMVFRPGGDFLTSFGSAVEYDTAVLQAKIGEKIKRRYVNEGVFKEDLADVTWGGIYEGSANWGHLEEVGMFDRRDGKSEERFRYLEETADTTVKEHVGFGISNLEPGAWKTFGPLLYNYHLWQGKIKQAFDPEFSADANFYVPPIDEMEKEMDKKE